MSLDTNSDLIPAQRYTPAQVADRILANRQYFWECLRASSNETFRKKRKIPLSTIKSMPLLHWDRCGVKWFIRGVDLIPQLNTRRLR